MLSGYPLALVRASLNAELIGRRVNQTWAAFEQDFRVAQSSANDENPLIERTTNHHEDVKYPVVLGVVSDPDDGLSVSIRAEMRERSDLRSSERSRFQGTRLPDRPEQGAYHPAHGRGAETRANHARRSSDRRRGDCGIRAFPEPVAASRSNQKRVRQDSCNIPGCAVLTREKPPTDENGKVALPLPLPGQQKGAWNWVRVVMKRTEAAGPSCRHRSCECKHGYPRGSALSAGGWLSLGEPGKGTDQNRGIG